MKKQKQFSVSLVYQKTECNTVSNELRVSIITANNSEEALGKFIVELTKDATLKNFSLALRVTIEIKTNK